MSLLEVKDLCVSFLTDEGEIKAVNSVSFNLDRGEVIGIVGESGSGKSVTAYSIMQILHPSAKIISGSIKLNGTEIVGADEKTMKAIRGKKISIIFQDPMTSLNPTYTIGHQLCEAILLHKEKDKNKAYERATEMLKLVNVNDPEKRMKQYPFEISGGMRQRIMIAMALACEPDILIADEPTTALDVTIQAQILELMKKIQTETKTAIIMITHDLGVVADLCDKVIVMYAGSVCERGTIEDIFFRPEHEYTKGLLGSVPNLETAHKKLKAIPGTPVDLLCLPKGCAFAPRCKKAMKVCVSHSLNSFKVSNDHYTTCWEYARKYIENEVGEKNGK